MENKTEKKLLIVVIVVMIVCVLVLCFVLVTGVRRVGGVASSGSLRSFLSLKRTHGPLPLTDASLIRPWMTFDYINELFGLPVNYLKTSLDIVDPRYPNLSLSEYDESIATSTLLFLGEVEKAVLESTSTPQ